MASKLQKQVLDFLKTLPECWHCKVIAANKRGVPDILCCIKGVFFAFEIKEGNDRLSTIQLMQGELINASQGCFAEIRSLEDVITAINYHLPINYRVCRFTNGDKTNATKIQPVETNNTILKNKNQKVQTRSRVVCEE